MIFCHSRIYRILIVVKLQDKYITLPMNLSFYWCICLFVTGFGCIEGVAEMSDLMPDRMSDQMSEVCPKA